MQGATSPAGIEDVKEFESCVVGPSLLTARRRWLRHQENFAKPPKQTQPGWFSFWIHRKTTPASRLAEASRYFLVARPPLLAVMQGGDYRARFQFIHTFIDRRFYEPISS